VIENESCSVASSPPSGAKRATANCQLVLGAPLRQFFNTGIIGRNEERVFVRIKRRRVAQPRQRRGREAVVQHRDANKAVLFGDTTRQINNLTIASSLQRRCGKAQQQANNNTTTTSKRNDELIIGTGGARERHADHSTSGESSIGAWVFNERMILNRSIESSTTTLPVADCASSSRSLQRRDSSRVWRLRDVLRGAQLQVPRAPPPPRVMRNSKRIWRACAMNAMNANIDALLAMLICAALCRPRRRRAPR
jgi:hypothetical protein